MFKCTRCGKPSGIAYSLCPECIALDGEERAIPPVPEPALVPPDGDAIVPTVARLADRAHPGTSSKQVKPRLWYLYGVVMLYAGAMVVPVVFFAVTNPSSTLRGLVGLAALASLFLGLLIYCIVRRPSWAWPILTIALTAGPLWGAFNAAVLHLAWLAALALASWSLANWLYLVRRRSLFGLKPWARRHELDGVHRPATTAADSDLSTLRRGLQSPDPAVRERCAILLGDQGAAATVAVPDLTLLLNDSNRQVRNRVKWALQTIARKSHE
jgi:hypothetical protein